MSLKDEIKSAVEGIFGDQWSTREGNVVPDADDVGLGNDAVLVNGTVLYADLSGSTNMVDRYKPHFSAEIYKAYLYSTAKVIRSEGGEIVAYDGDRVMAVFIGKSKNTSAARCGLKINWAVKNLVTPLMKNQYPNTTFALHHVVGIDTSNLWVARTGVRGANDLVWVGPAANYAAKLTELDSSHSTWITHRVYDNMNDVAKKSADGSAMWDQRLWKTMSDLVIYRSSFWWSF
jgi:class 3 adenylate cyclase